MAFSVGRCGAFRLISSVDAKQDVRPLSLRVQRRGRLTHARVFVRDVGGSGKSMYVSRAEGFARCIGPEGANATKLMAPSLGSSGNQPRQDKQ